MRRWIGLVTVSILSFSLAVGAGAESLGTDGTADTAAGGTVSSTDDSLTFDTFIAALSEALSTREESIAELTEGLAAETDTTTILEACRQLAVEELNTLAAYQEEFALDADTSTTNENEKKNKDYIRQAYLEGLTLQAEADTSDEDEFWSAWQRGFSFRAAAVVEILTYYDKGNVLGGTLSSDIIAQMKEETGEACTDGEYALWFVQALTGASVDGYNGYNTRYYLKAYQEDNDLVLNGVINDRMVTDMILQLVDTKEEEIRKAAASAEEAWTAAGKTVEATIDCEAILLEAKNAANTASETEASAATNTGNETDAETEIYTETELNTETETEDITTR